jgi:hypothetical protein
VQANPDFEALCLLDLISPPENPTEDDEARRIVGAQILAETFRALRAPRTDG